jgi:hypothetical protein
MPRVKFAVYIRALQCESRTNLSSCLFYILYFIFRFVLSKCWTCLFDGRTPRIPTELCHIVGLPRHERDRLARLVMVLVLVLVCGLAVKGPVVLSDSAPFEEAATNKDCAKTQSVCSVSFATCSAGKAQSHH